MPAMVNNMMPIYSMYNNEETQWQNYVTSVTDILVPCEAVTWLSK